MKKKKMYRWILTSVLTVFMACILFTFAICSNYSQNEYLNYCSDFANWMMEKVILNDDYLSKDKKMYRLSAAIAQNGSFYMGDPAFYSLPKRLLDHRESLYATKAAIFDQNGDILLESGNDLYFSESSGINLDSFLTRKGYKELKKYQKKMGNQRITCHSLGYHKENGKIIADVLSFDDKTEIPITDYDPEAYFTVDENIYSMDLFLRDDDHIFLKSIYEKLDQKMRSEEIRESARWISMEEEGDGLEGYDSSEYELFYKRKINGEPCTVAILMDHSTVLDVLKSRLFRTFALIEFVICSIVGLFLVMVFGKLYEKKENLQNAKEAFTNAVAHELKTPIAIIQNYSECILEGIRPEKTPKYAHTIHEEAVRMDHLVISFLQYNRLNQLDNIEFEKISFLKLMKGELVKIQPLLQAKGMRLDSRMEKDYVIQCNAELMALAMHNLITNAIQYGDRDTEIIIDVTEDKGECTFSVKNQCGNWNHEEDLWSIHSKSGEELSEIRSTGLGLPITSKILNLHKFRYGYEYNAEKKMVDFHFSFRSNE